MRRFALPSKSRRAEQRHEDELYPSHLQNILITNKSVPAASAKRFGFFWLRTSCSIWRAELSPLKILRTNPTVEPCISSGTKICPNGSLISSKTKTEMAIDSSPTLQFGKTVLRSKPAFFLSTRSHMVCSASVIYNVALHRLRSAIAPHKVYYPVIPTLCKRLLS